MENPEEVAKSHEELLDSYDLALKEFMFNSNRPILHKRAMKGFLKHLKMTQ